MRLTLLFQFLRTANLEAQLLIAPLDMSNHVQVLCSKAAVHNQAVENHKDYLLP